MLGVELWADGALRDCGNGSTPSLWEQALATDEFTLEHVSALIRAAYAVGYQNALEDPRPLTYADAMTRRDQLELKLPV